MSPDGQPVSRLESPGAALSLYHLLDPEVLANPYPLFHRLRRESPVHWDPFLHAWIVTRYNDVLEVLQSFSADRTPTPEQLAGMGLSQLSPLAQLMVKQMLFMDAPAHTRLRTLASKAFTPARIQVLKDHIRDIVDRLLAAVREKGGMDVIADLAEPLPAIVTAEMLGVPVSDHRKLKIWSANFAEMLGNFQHNPDHAQVMLQTVEQMTAYFREAIEEQKQQPREGLIHYLLTAEIDGDRLTDEEVVANTIITMVGGQETTTNLIGNGVLTLLRYPGEMQKLRDDLSLIPSAVEEMLRFESPSQHTARLAPSDRELGGEPIRKRQAVIAVMAAANRDPERFPEPDRFDITRQDNRHLAFGYAAHFCFGAPLARMEGQIAFEALFRTFDELRMEPQELVWRTNLGLRGLRSLKIRFDTPGRMVASQPVQEPGEKVFAKSDADESALGATEIKRHTMPADSHNMRAEYPSRKCVHDLVSDRAALSPDAIAVIHGDQQLTFRELNERANQLADYLRKKGIGKDVPAGICLKRSVELAVALLGVMKAGGACLPLDPDYPDERLAYMLEDSEAPVLVTQPGLLPELGNAKPEVVHFSSDWKILEGCSRENPSGPANPENLAYVIYTSGSTGKPRGVLLEHRSLVNHHLAALDLYELGPADRTLQFSSLSFDIAIEEIFPTWIAGGTLVLRTEEMPLAGSGFLRWIRERGITVLDLPTAYWHELVRELTESGESLPESLRLLIVGGEKASASAFASWVKCGGGGVRWVNTYGPTEASIIVSSYEPDASQPVPENLPIGRAIANTRLYILDEQLKPVAVGTPGELYISGAGVARGYLRRPEITAAKFIADPFSREPGARLYRTGDLVRCLSDGNIEFLGRADFQVKIRGFRVELGEIEAVLETHPGVAEAVVIAHEVNGEKRLAAYVIASQRKPAGIELSKYLRERLPEYMVPADFVFLETMPLTPNGKVDRRALPLPEPRDVERQEDFVGPRNQFESSMTRLWEQILGKRPVSVRDNFFELGGHSLAAARLMGQVEKEFGKKLLLTDLLQAPTVEELVALVRLDAPSAARSSVIALQPLGPKPPFFFVHGLGGSVLRFRDLARHMAPDQPFFGIQAQGLDGTQPCLHRVEDMADLYLEHLKSAQGKGPYFLGGYSFGGYVALEMARRLLAQGEEVRALVLLDTYAGGQQSLLGRFLTLSTAQKIAYLKRRAERYWKGIKRRIDIMRLPDAVKKVRRACAAAGNSYRLQAYPERILLFSASDKGLRGLDDPGGGWSKYAPGGLELHQIDGDHGNILNEPNVRLLAADLRQCLERAQTDRSQTFSAGEPRPTGPATQLTADRFDLNFMNPTKAPTETVDMDIAGLAASDRLRSEQELAQSPVAENHSTPGGESVFAMFRKWATKGGLAIIDYGLISGSNFLLGVLLARWLTPREYGAYALSFSFFILAGFLYQSLLLEPLSVFSGTLFRDNIRGYLKTALGIHWALSLAMCLVLAIAAVVTSVVGHSAVLAVALSGMTIATPFILMHGLARRSFYLKLSPGPAAFASVFYCALVTGGVFVVFRLGWLSSFAAFLIMGAAALVTCVIMVFQLNAALEPATGHPKLRATWAKHWEYGRWALATCVVGWIPNYIYIPLVSSFSGMAAAGELRALMNLAAPVLQTYAALSMLFLPYAARVQNQSGRRAAASLNRRLACLFVAGSVVYWAILIPLKQPLFHFLYAGKYLESAYLIPLFALETTIWSASLGPAILLRAMESPRSLFIANGAASAIAVLIGIPATRYFGLQGVIWSMIGANFLYVVVAFILFGRKITELKGDGVNLEPLPTV